MRFQRKNRICSTLVFLAFSLFLAAQTPGAYVPINARDGQLETLRPVFNQLFEQSTATLSGPYKKEYRQLYEGLRDSRLKEAENGYFLLDKGLERYFAAMLQSVKAANPGILVRDIRFFVSRDAVSNASTYPDGVILFDIGMLAACTNESQAAFVLCHELAHHELAHGAKSIAKRFEALYSKQAQQEMAKIAKQSNAHEKALAYLADFAYEHGRHGREHEAEADSLAARFLLRTGYDATQAIGALEMLGIVDSTFYAPGFDLEKTFQFPDYPFKARWVAAETTLFQDGRRVFDGSLNKDSLKTHPDCQHRAALMRERYLRDYQVVGKLADPQGSELFQRMRQTAQYESLLASFDADKVDLCLFHTLNQLHDQPSDLFLNALVGRCFNQLYAAQKDHVFSRYVHPPRIEYDAGYKRWLQFLNNLRLRELAAIGYHFLNTRDSAFLQDDNFQYQLLVAARNMELPAETAKFKTDYLQRFPKGKYRAVVQQF